MRSKPAARAELDGPPDVGGVVRAPERREDVRHHRLHAEAQPVDAGTAVRGELGRVDAVGVALDGDLGVGGALDRVEDAGELGPRDQRRSATAEEHARRRRQALVSPAGDVGDARGDVLVDEMVPVGPRREIAVVTSRRAERDVDVDAERGPGGHAPWSRGAGPPGFSGDPEGRTPGALARRIKSRRSQPSSATRVNDSFNESFADPTNPTNLPTNRRHETRRISQRIVAPKPDESSDESLRRRRCRVATELRWRTGSGTTGRRRATLRR